MNKPKNPELLILALKTAIEALIWMPVEMWCLWVIWVLEKLREHAEDEREYEKFLTQLTLALVGRTETKIEPWMPIKSKEKVG